jgi:adhesin transport system membrane fusion protein
MFGRGPEEDFVNDPAARPRGGRGGGSWALLLLVAAALGGFAYWAYSFEIEEVTRGMGRVIPSSQVQVVQAPQGGIVAAIEVREGDIVEAGDVLVQIDDTSVAADRGELLEREAALLAEALRLEAEAAQAEALDFPPELAARAPLATAAEGQVFTSRRAQLERELQVLRDQLDQRRAALEELRATRTRTEAVIAPLSEELALTEDLAARGAVPQIELLRLRSRMAELQGDLQVAAASAPKLEAAVREAETRIDSARSAYVLAARERLAKLQVELAVVQESLTAASDRVSRTLLRAPVRGTVNALGGLTLGAVVERGAPLAEIVPLDDGLLIEADIRPSDVAFIRPGDRASVKITAYDYLVYGALKGTVARIGANTIRGAEGEELFRVVVETSGGLHAADGAELPIIPGMVAQVDVQTGRKTVLSYLAKPLLRARAEALREP